MAQRVVLLTPARRFIANRFGLGYQIPLGLVCIGGPLVDAGHTVWLVDNDLYGWGPARLAAELRRFRPDCVLLGHTGSTAAHSVCLATAAAVRAALPWVRIAYGGVYPSYEEAVERFVEKYGRQPAVVLVNPTERVDEVARPVVARPTVGKDQFWLGEW